MSNINNWFSIISNNDLHAFNKVNNRDLSICFNFIQIPDTATVAMTVTIMKNKVKKNSLDPNCFARVMNCIEDSLYECCKEFNGNTEKEHFFNVKDQLNNQWYIQLCCHRIFFIPEKALWLLISHLFNQSNISKMKENNIEEVSVYVNTENYDFNGKFY